MHTKRLGRVIGGSSIGISSYLVVRPETENLSASVEFHSAGDRPGFYRSQVLLQTGLATEPSSNGSIPVTWLQGDLAGLG